MITDEETECIIKKSLSELIRMDLYLIEKNLKEECINHRLAVHLCECIKKSNLGLIIDLEYDKSIDGQKKRCSNKKPMRPDIIIHKRGDNENNFLAIEAKKGYSTQHDWDKIRDLFECYNYTYGCVISYFPKRDHIKYIFLTKNSFKERIGAEDWKKLKKSMLEDSG